MRYDMAKVLIENARTQSSAKSRKWAKRYKYVPDYDYEDEITRVHGSRRWQYGYDYKQSTDVLGPLKGYLLSKVGQCWNDTYSEICANLDRRSVTGAHVFTHLWDYVERNCYIASKGRIKVLGHDYGPRWFYVHPKTGILCDSKNEGWTRYGRWSRKKKKIPVTKVDLEEGKTAYEWINGVWYYTESSHVTLYKERWSFMLQKKVLDPYVESVRYLKRQLGKKELKKLGLSNKALKFRSA